MRKLLPTISNTFFDTPPTELMASLKPYALAPTYLFLELDVVLSGEGFL
jgi:hypothetical protein